MDIENLIQNYIKKRPCMFIEKLNFDYLRSFLNGFLCCSYYTQKDNRIDSIFKNEFHDWTRKWIEKNKNMIFDVNVDYVFYIRSVCQTEKECFDLFFDLCDIFFKEVHDKIENNIC